MNCGDSRQFDKVVPMLNSIAECAQLRNEIRFKLDVAVKQPPSIISLYLGCHIPLMDCDAFC